MIHRQMPLYFIPTAHLFWCYFWVVKVGTQKQAERQRRTMERASEGKASAHEHQRANVIAAVAEKVVAMKQDLLW